jgi:hypothetical protein
MGRPSTYSADVAAEICRRLSTGETLKAICREDAFPPDATVRLWALNNVEGFAAQYAAARDLGLDAMADDLLEIADTPQDGVTTTDQEWGTSEKRGDMLEHRKLRYDARKWYLSKLAPKRYGDRLNVEATVDVSVGAAMAAARDRAREG